MPETPLSRRQFIGAATGGATAALTVSLAGSATQNPEQTMIGIQMPVAPLVNQDVGQLLDELQDRACVNTLFVFIFTYVNAWTAVNKKEFHGGNYATVHPRYYQDTVLKPEDTQATELGGVDVLARLLPQAKKRGVRTFCWVIEDNRRPDVPNMDQLWEIDLYGRRAERHPAGPCFNNPNYHNFLMGLMEDYARSYPIDGIMWGSERQGPLGNALGAYHGGLRSDPGRVTCFCQYCVRKGERQGIAVNRARKGYHALEQFVREGRAGKRPRDGYQVSFWRILLDYPEILGWEKLWTDGLHETHKAIYAQVKSIRPSLQVGWHIWHNHSFNPLYRAEQDYRKFTPYSDFLKPVLYHDAAGERMLRYLNSVSQNQYGDIPTQELLQFIYHVMNYREEELDRMAIDGFSGDYVYRETKRALAGVAGGQTQIWPGIGIDVPNRDPEHAHSSPSSVRQAVLGALRAGAQGVLLSRNYAEMKPENLSAAGQAVKAFGLG